MTNSTYLLSCLFPHNTLTNPVCSLFNTPVSNPDTTNAWGGVLGQSAVGNILAYLITGGEEFYGQNVYGAGIRQAVEIVSTQYDIFVDKGAGPIQTGSARFQSDNVTLIPGDHLNIIPETYPENLRLDRISTMKTRGTESVTI